MQKAMGSEGGSVLGSKVKEALPGSAYVNQAFADQMANWSAEASNRSKAQRAIEGNSKIAAQVDEDDKSYHGAGPMASWKDVVGNQVKASWGGQTPSPL